MSNSNVVADVTKLATAALKKGHPLHGQELKPSQWASKVGYSGAAAGPLRKFMARDSGNGCGRRGRYPAMSAEVFLDVLHDAAAFHAEAEERKRDAIRGRIATKLRPAAAKGASQAKDTAKTKAPVKEKATA